MKSIEGVLSEDQVSDLTDDEYVAEQLVTTSRAREAYLTGLPFESRMAQAQIPTTTVPEKESSSGTATRSGGTAAKSGSRSGRSNTRSR